MKHIGLKIIAFIFGIALWLYVLSLDPFQIAVDVPVRLIRMPEKISLASLPPENITVNLEGKAFDLMRLKSRIKKGDTLAAVINIDMQNAELGVSRYVIDSRNFNCAIAGIKFLEPDNQQLFIDVELDTKVSREVPIHSNVTLNVATGYLLTEEPRFEPEMLAVYGARNSIARIINIPTDTLLFDSLKEAHTYSVPINLKGFNSYISLEQKSIDMHVNVQKIVSKKFKKVPVQLIGFYDSKNQKLDPDSIDVEITGGEKILDSLTKEKIELFVQYNRFAIEDVDSLSPIIKLNLNSQINQEMSIKARQTFPEKVRLKQNFIPKEEPLDTVKVPVDTSVVLEKNKKKKKGKN